MPVILWEMRPVKSTAAHRTGDLAELVCSNSLRSDDPLHAAGLLKREMGRFGSLVIAAAREAAVPAGSALAVDRERFARRVTATLEGEPLVEVRRRELLTVEGVAYDADLLIELLARSTYLRGGYLESAQLLQDILNLAR